VLGGHSLVRDEGYIYFFCLLNILIACIWVRIQFPIQEGLPLLGLHKEPVLGIGSGCWEGIPLSGTKGIYISFEYINSMYLG